MVISLQFFSLTILKICIANPQLHITRIQLLHVTADNAGNNGTFMQWTEEIVKAKGNIHFGAEKSYIWCMNHVLNLSVKRAIIHFEASIVKVFSR